MSSVVRPGWARRTVVVDTFPESPLRHMDRDAVVCVDVMQSGTTLLTALEQGRRAFVTTSIDEIPHAAGLGNALIAGDASPQCAAVAPGFDALDSPCALALQERERPLILCSAPGTELIVMAGRCANALVAAFRNITATVEHLARHYRNVALLAAGCREEFSSEDQMAVAWIAEGLIARGFEAEDPRTRDLVRRWHGIEPTLAGWGNSAERLRQSGRTEDLELILSHVDDVGIACAYRQSEDGRWGEVAPVSVAAATAERRQAL